ncbi:unnamed protein product [Enterobius vermicularis]|uniref:Uncharacterized protein n=1 Tax=Enterobius vermicularis TaxID=51028 RepID=A0A0N4UWV7_ENTVE|nr:unnamed protein product [Enterobius vermicularis]
MDMAEDYTDENERRFYEFVRQHLIYFLLFIFLYLISYSLLRYFKKRSDYDELYAGKEDFFVFRTSLWMCTCSLAVSLAAATLLPFSVIGSEIIYAYPNNYYFKWLNWPLIHTLWNYIFGLSNLSLFILLPFAYFFIESQGIRGHGKVRYTVLFLFFLFFFVVFHLVYRFLLFQSRTLSISLSIINFTSVNLPFIYSCVSLFGVLTLLITTPVGKWLFVFSKTLCTSLFVIFFVLGFTRMFTMVSDHLLAPFEVQLEHRSGDDPKYDNEFGWRNPVPTGNLSCIPSANSHFMSFSRDRHLRSRNVRNGSVNYIFNKTPEPFLPEKPLRGYQKVLQSIKFPLAIIILLVLTVIYYSLLDVCLNLLHNLGVSVLMVIINILQLLFGYRALPAYVQYINVNSRHIFGIFGAFVEIVIIWYLMLASLVGLYSAPILKRMRPRKAGTSMTSIVANCTTVLILSSALPVLARTLGITTFDLLGEYGNLNWLSNLKLVLAYNVVFLVPTVLCLVNHFTASVRKEVVRRSVLFLFI